MRNPAPLASRVSSYRRQTVPQALSGGSGRFPNLPGKFSGLPTRVHAASGRAAGLDDRRSSLAGACAWKPEARAEGAWPSGGPAPAMGTATPWPGASGLKEPAGQQCRKPPSTRKAAETVLPVRRSGHRPTDGDPLALAVGSCVTDRTVLPSVPRNLRGTTVVPGSGRAGLTPSALPHGSPGTRQGERCPTCCRAAPVAGSRTGRTTPVRTAGGPFGWRSVAPATGRAHRGPGRLAGSGAGAGRVV